MQKSQNTHLVCITFPNAATYTQQSTENIRATFGLNWMNGEGWVDVFACMKAWRVKEKFISKVIRLERKCGVKKGAVVSVVAYVDIDSFDSAKCLQQKLSSKGRRRMIFIHNSEDLQGLEKSNNILSRKTINQHALFIIFHFIVKVIYNLITTQ